MIISGWRVDGYGVFADYLVEGLGSGITVLHGPNEAGKSTLLDFLRFMLFGLSRGDARHEPLAGGRHGGYLYLLDEGGAQWTIERQAIPRARLAVARPGGGRGGEQDLLRLSGGVDAMSFRNVFAFSLAELSQFETLSAKEVKDRIFSAGISGAGDDAGAARRRLDERASQLLRPRSGGRLNNLASDLAQKRRELESATDRAQAYPSEVGREQEAGQQVERLVAKVQELEEQARRLETLLDSWKPYNLWTASERQLRAMPDPQIAPELAGEMRDLRVETKITRQHQEALAGQAAQLERERAAVKESPALSAVAGDAGRIASQLALQRERLSRRTTTRAGLADLDRELRGLLGRLGIRDHEGAPAGGLRDLALPVTLGDELLSWERTTADACRKAQSAADRAEDAIRKERLARGRAETLKSELKQVLQGLTLDEVIARRERLDTIERTAGRLARARTRHLAGLAAGAVLIATALGAFIAGYPLWSWTLGSAGVVSALAGLLLGGRSAGADARALRSLAREAGLKASPDQAAIEEARSRLREAEVAARDMAEAVVRIRAADEELVRAEAESAELSAAATAASEAASRLEAQWREWKAEMSFPQALSADGVRAYVDLLGQAQQRAAAIARARAELSRTEEDIGAWEEAARGVLGQAAAARPDLAPPALPPAELLDAIAVLNEEAGDALANEREARELSQRLLDATAQLADCQAKLNGLITAHRALLERAGARDDDDFDRRVAETEARDKLLAEVAERRAAVDARLGHGEYADGLRETLESENPESWRAELDRVQESLTQAKQEHIQAIEDRRDAQLAREALEVSADIPKLAAQEAALVSEIDRAVSEWRIVRVAQILIERALEAYVRERQPEVLQVASRVFSRISGGRYTAVVQETAGEGLSVLESRGSSKSPAQLSRGTVEQLYLSMRLGLADSIARRATPLPLVMDDVLVNFDPGRARRLVQSLIDYLGPGGRQILLFTCHPETRDLVAAVAPDSRLIEIGQSMPAARAEVAASAALPFPDQPASPGRPAAGKRKGRQQP